MSPFSNSKTATNLAWQNMHNSKLPQAKDSPLKPAKDNIDTPSTVNMLSHDSNFHFTSKVLPTKSINPGYFTFIATFLCWFFFTLAGVEDFMNFSDTNATQDFTCALSLLSTNQWDSYATKSISEEHSNRSTSAFQAITHAMNQRIPLASSEPWCSDHDQYVNSNMWISNSADSNHFQKFQLLKEPYEYGFHQLG
jgi:hypothetical protein